MFIQNKQRFAVLSFAVDKICHIGVHCIGAMCVIIYLWVVFPYQSFLNYDSINRLKIKMKSLEKSLLPLALFYIYWYGILLPVT